MVMQMPASQKNLACALWIMASISTGILGYYAKVLGWADMMPIQHYQQRASRTTSPWRFPRRNSRWYTSTCPQDNHFAGFKQSSAVFACGYLLSTAVTCLAMVTVYLPREFFWREPSGATPPTPGFLYSAHAIQTLGLCPRAVQVQLLKLSKWRYST